MSDRSPEEIIRSYELLVGDYQNLVDVLVWHLIENNAPPCSSFHEGTDWAVSDAETALASSNGLNASRERIQGYLAASKRASGIMSVEEFKELSSDPNYEG